MKRSIYLAAALLSCMWLLTACMIDNHDNPAPSEEQKAQENRQVLISHIESDAKTLAENISSESLNATSQVYAQLLALIKLDRNFIKNMRTIFSAISERKSSAKVYPVTAGSELAERGYLLYITMDNGGFGAQVILDGKGGSRLTNADHLEFIFPAYVKGIGSTLFKLIVQESDEYYQSVSTFNNLKRVACINRLPKSVTLTLNGFISNQELTLSESVIHLELPQDEDSEYVSFDANSFRLTGRQVTSLNANDESALDYSLTMNSDQMTLNYDYTRNGRSIISCDAMMELPQQESFISQMLNNAFDITNLKALTVRIVDDLLLTGTIDNGTSFAQDFANAIKNRQQSASPEDLADVVESLNQSSHLQVSCKQMTMPEIVKFTLVQKEEKYMIEPALQELESDRLIPISQLLDEQTMDDINKPFGLSFTPAGNASSSVLKFYSVFMQMMPIAGT